jgi:hypothetical protein
MIEIKGTVTEVVYGEEIDSIKVKFGKMTSTIKRAAGDFNNYEPGDPVVVIIEKEQTLFDRRKNEED